MNLIEIKVDADEFKTYLYTIRGRFSIMLQAMIDVAEVIHANTMPLTPLDTGQLGESFSWQTLRYSKDMILVEVKMDAVDPNNGFHYAQYQHDTLSLYHPHGQALYLREGIHASESMAYEIIEQDYLSMFGGIRVNG